MSVCVCVYVLYLRVDVCFYSLSYYLLSLFDNSSILDIEHSPYIALGTTHNHKVI